MNKGFELTKSQISAFENGAKMFLVPILGLEKTSLNQNSFPFVLNINNKYEMMTEFEVIRKLLPIQKDDEKLFYHQAMPTLNFLKSFYLHFHQLLYIFYPLLYHIHT